MKPDRTDWRLRDSRTGLTRFAVLRISDSWGEKLAGAEGFEPSPSSLTVRCPTDWTTPQQLHQRLLEEESSALFGGYGTQDSIPRHMRKQNSKVLERIGNQLGMTCIVVNTCFARDLHGILYLVNTT